MARVLTDRDTGDETEEIEFGEEHLRVVTWRQKWLKEAGYSNKNSGTLAYRTDINYKDACDLLLKCKDQEQAMSILL
jgi:hypothetical protein